MYTEYEILTFKMCDTIRPGPINVANAKPRSSIIHNTDTECSSDNGSIIFVSVCP